jgi:hypothetical protein
MDFIFPLIKEYVPPHLRESQRNGSATQNMPANGFNQSGPAVNGGQYNNYNNQSKYCI